MNLSNTASAPPFVTTFESSNSCLNKFHRESCVVICVATSSREATDSANSSSFGLRCQNLRGLRNDTVCDTVDTLELQYKSASKLY